MYSLIHWLIELKLMVIKIFEDVYMEISLCLQQYLFQQHIVPIDYILRQPFFTTSCRMILPHSRRSMPVIHRVVQEGFTIISHWCFLQRTKDLAHSLAVEVNRMAEPKLSTYMSMALWQPSRRWRVLATATEPCFPPGSHFNGNPALLNTSALHFI